MDNNAIFIFASCYSQDFAKSVTEKTGYSSVGADDFVGPSHSDKNYGHGSFNMFFNGASSFDSTYSFKYNSKKKTTNIGKLLNIPNIISSGKNGYNKKISPYKYEY